MAAQPQFVHPEHRSFVDLSGHNLANPHPFAGSTVGRSPDLREALGGHPSPLPAGSPAPAQNSRLRPLRPVVPVAQGARALPDVLALAPDLEPVPCFCSPCPVPQGSGGACGVCGGGQGLAAPAQGPSPQPRPCVSLCSRPQHGDRRDRGVCQLLGFHDHPGGVPDPGRSSADHAGPRRRQGERDGLGRLRLDHHREPHGGRRGRVHRDREPSAGRGKAGLTSEEHHGTSTSACCTCMLCGAQVALSPERVNRGPEACSRSCHRIRAQTHAAHVHRP